MAEKPCRYFPASALWSSSERSFPHSNPTIARGSRQTRGRALEHLEGAHEVGRDGQEELPVRVAARSAPDDSTSARNGPTASCERFGTPATFRW